MYYVLYVCLIHLLSCIIFIGRQCRALHHQHAIKEAMNNACPGNHGDDETEMSTLPDKNSTKSLAMPLRTPRRGTPAAPSCIRALKRRRCVRAPSTMRPKGQHCLTRVLPRGLPAMRPKGQHPQFPSYAVLPGCGYKPIPVLPQFFPAITQSGPESG